MSIPAISNSMKTVTASASPFADPPQTQIMYSVEDSGQITTCTVQMQAFFGNATVNSTINFGPGTLPSPLIPSYHPCVIRSDSFADIGSILVLDDGSFQIGRLSGTNPSETFQEGPGGVYSTCFSYFCKKSE